MADEKEKRPNMVAMRNFLRGGKLVEIGEDCSDLSDSDRRLLRNKLATEDSDAGKAAIAARKARAAAEKKAAS